MLEEALQTLNISHALQELKQRWLVLLLKDYATPKNSPLKEWVERNSTKFPMLYFQHPADHGWGYNLFYGGTEVASVYCDYELSWNMAFDKAQELNPDVDPIWLDTTEEGDALFKQVKESNEYRALVNVQYAHANPEQFQLFRFSKASIDRLTEILTPEWYLDESRLLQQVMVFKETIEAVDMEWMSYHYHEKDNSST